MRRTTTELAIVAAVAAGAYWVWGLPLAATALVVLGALVGVLLLRVLPATDAPHWPRLPAPERAGRRAEIFRLSWNLGSSDAVGGAVHRLRGLLDTRLRTAPAAERPTLEDLSLRLDALDLTLTDVGAILDTLERLDSTQPATQQHPTTAPTDRESRTP